MKTIEDNMSLPVFFIILVLLPFAALAIEIVFIVLLRLENGIDNGGKA